MDFSIFDNPRPEVEADGAADIVSGLYGIDGTAEPLRGERDRTFKITTSSEAFVLKVGNDADRPDALDGQAGAMEHALRMDPLLPIPAVVRTAKGNLSARHQGHSVQLTTFIEGANPPTTDTPPGLRRSVGTLAARLSRALRGYDHPALHRAFPWDLAQLGELAPLVQDVEPELRPAIEAAFAALKDEVAIRISSLGKQAVHGDINHDNMVVDPDYPERIIGLFDFGDMIWGSRIFELAVAAAYQSFGADPTVAIAQMAAAFHIVEPLEPNEMELLPHLVAARAAQSILMAKRFAALHPDNADYLSGDSADMAETLKRLNAADPEEAVARIRNACGVKVGRRTSVDAALRLRYQRLGPALALSYDEPVRLDRGEGVWLFEEGGRALLDAYNNVPHVGHAHPQVVAALSAQSQLLTTNTRYLVDEVAEYADRLAALLPEPLDVVMFVNSGSEANDLAYQIAGVVTKKPGLITTENAYHGTTFATAAMSPEEYPSTRWTPPTARVGGVETLQARNPDVAIETQLTQAGERLESNGGGAGMVIFDTVFSSEGIYEPPAGYLGSARTWAKTNGVLFVADEVQAGFGRIGPAIWGFAAEGIVPDIVTLGKPMGNGYPMGAVVTTASIAAEFSERWHFFSTFAGSPVAAAVGNAVLDVMETEELPQNAEAVGAYLRNGIASIADQNVVDVRGPGLFVGVELTGPEVADGVVNDMRRRGVLIGITGPDSNVLKIRPPLVFTERHADMVIAELDASLQAVSGQRTTRPV
jgi:4-aminobutyrate aminotransferase-like enzyme/aminoglycoside phosphotransferase (APT) family kinase protein